MITGALFVLVITVFMVGNVIMMLVEWLFGTHIASVSQFQPALLVYWIIITLILRALVELEDI